MRKLFALYINELIKSFKKLSVLIIIILMAVAVIGYPLLMRITTQFTSTDIFTSYKDDYEAELEYLNEQKLALQSKIDAATSTDAASNELKYDMQSIDNDIFILKLYMDNDINEYTDNSFRMDAISQIDSYLYELISLKRQAEVNPDVQEEIDLYNSYIDDLVKLIENNDYKSYIDISKRSIQDDDSLTPEEKEINLEYYDLLYLNDPTGSGEISGLTSALKCIKDERLSLYSGINQVDYNKYNMPLSIEDEEYIKNKLAVDLYNVEHKYIATYDSFSDDYIASTAFNSCISFGGLFVAILVMILAGTAISQEIATGSIKSLIIAPVKRWKIMLAKILSLLTVTITCLLTLYLISLISCTLCFGTSVQLPYVYAKAGTAYEIPYLLYSLCAVGVRGIKIAVYMIFALLLSTITRNSALAVGLSVGTYFGIDSVFNIISVFASDSEWIKFLPFEHLDLAAKFFEYSPIYTSAYSGMLTTSGTSLTFSLIYLGVLTFTMLLTSFDSFNHRDIK